MQVTQIIQSEAFVYRLPSPRRTQKLCPNPTEAERHVYVFTVVSRPALTCRSLDRYATPDKDGCARTATALVLCGVAWWNYGVGGCRIIDFFVIRSFVTIIVGGCWYKNVYKLTANAMMSNMCHSLWMLNICCLDCYANYLCNILYYFVVVIYDSILI